MFKRMGHAAIKVSDVKRAVEFYRDVLGFDVAYEGDGDWAGVELGGDDLGLISKDSVKHPPHLGLRVESLEALQKAQDELQKKGVKILRSLNAHRDGSHSFYFADVDGNVLEALWDPRYK